MAWNDLQGKIEAAFKTHIEGATSLVERGQASVYTSVATGTLSLPAIVVEAAEGDEFPAFSGNFWMECDVTILSPADPKTPGLLDEHTNRTAYVLDSVLVDSLPEDLSAAEEDLTVFGVAARTTLPEILTERHFGSGLRLRLYAAPSNLTDNLLVTQGGDHLITQAGDRIAIR